MTIANGLGSSLKDRINSRLSDLQMTQAELAERAGISPVMVFKLTSGEITKTSHMLKLAHSLQCDPQWLENSELYNIHTKKTTALLTGEALGAAIDQAIKKKGVIQAEVVRCFNVKPPSVSGWISTGRINKRLLFDLFYYFSDVVDASLWGLGANETAYATGAKLPRQSKEALDWIETAIIDKRLSDDDMLALKAIAERLALWMIRTMRQRDYR